MTDAPELGVVVAAHGAERWLGETLGSLCSQRFRAFRCIVADDGSTDRTAAVADVGDPRVTVLRLPHRGQSAARNSGLAALGADVPYVAFLDADDLYTAGGLAALIALLRSRPDAVGAYGLAEYVDAASRPVRPGLHPARQRDRRGWHGARLRPVAPGADSTFADLVEYGPAWPSLVGVYRTAAVRAVGGFDEELGLREDWDLQVRLSRLGPLAALDEQVGWYRRHDANLTRGLVLDAVAAERVSAKAYVDGSRSQRVVCRRSSARRRAREVVVILRRLRTGRRPVELSRLLAAVAWSSARVLRAPAVGSPRRIWWAHGLPPGAPDPVWEP